MKEIIQLSTLFCCILFIISVWVWLLLYMKVYSTGETQVDFNNEVYMKEIINFI